MLSQLDLHMALIDTYHLHTFLFIILPLKKYQESLGGEADAVNLLTQFILG